MAEERHAVCESASRACSASQIKIFGHTAKSQSASGAFCLVILVISVRGKSLVDQSLDLYQVILKQLLFAVQKKKKLTRKLPNNLRVSQLTVHKILKVVSI